VQLPLGPLALWLKGRIRKDNKESAEHEGHQRCLEIVCAVVRPQRGGNQQNEFVESWGTQQSEHHAYKHVDQEAKEQAIQDLLEHWNILVTISLRR
jgi:hypothetical protein